MYASDLGSQVPPDSLSVLLGRRRSWRLRSQSMAIDLDTTNISAFEIEPAAKAVVSRLMWKMQRRPSDSSASSLLDDLIGPRKHGWWDRQTERLGSPHVDHQLERGGLLHGKIGGLRPLEDLVDVGRYPLNHGHQAWSIGDEAPRVRELS